jgi:hypothetical protein
VGRDGVVEEAHEDGSLPVRGPFASVDEVPLAEHPGGLACARRPRPGVGSGGEQHVDDLLAALEARMEPILLPEDYETLPPQHEARWRYNARWARKALVDDGLVLPPGRPGIWELTPAGRTITVE